MFFSLLCFQLFVDLFVTPVGFKPTTAGAEIQCAIQLRHEAFIYFIPIIVLLLWK